MRPCLTLLTIQMGFIIIGMKIIQFIIEIKDPQSVMFMGNRSEIQNTNDIVYNITLNNFFLIHDLSCNIISLPVSLQGVMNIKNIKDMISLEKITSGFNES